LDVGGGEDEVVGGGEHGPVAGVLGPGVGVEAVGLGVVEGPDPVDELRVPPVVGGVDPSAILDADDVVGGDGVVVQELLDGGGDVSLGGGGVGESGDGLEVVGRSSAPGVVAVVAEQEDARLAGVVEGGDVLVHLAGAQGAVAVLVAEQVAHGHHVQLVDLSGGGVHVLGLVGLVGVRRGEGSAASVDLAVPPVVAVGADLVGGVGRDHVPAVGAAVGVVHVVVQGAGQVAVGDDAPLDAFLHQDGDEPLAEGALGGPEAFGVGLGVAEGLLGEEAVGLELHPDHALAGQGAEHVVEGEGREVGPGEAVGGVPGAGRGVAALPVVAVAPLPGGAQALDVLHQAAGVVDLGPGVGVVVDGLDGLLAHVLVDVAPVVLAEDLLEVVQRVADALVGVLGVAVGLELVRLPDLLVLVGVRDADLRPVDRLLQVPHVGGVDLGLRAGRPQGQRGCQNG